MAVVNLTSSRISTRGAFNFETAQSRAHHWAARQRIIKKSPLVISLRASMTQHLYLYASIPIPVIPIGFSRFDWNFAKLFPPRLSPNVNYMLSRGGTGHVLRIWFYIQKWRRKSGSAPRSLTTISPDFFPLHSRSLLFFTFYPSPSSRTRAKRLLCISIGDEIYKQKGSLTVAGSKCRYTYVWNGFVRIAHRYRYYEIYSETPNNTRYSTYIRVLHGYAVYVYVPIPTRRVQVRPCRTKRFFGTERQRLTVIGSMTRLHVWLQAAKLMDEFRGRNHWNHPRGMILYIGVDADARARLTSRFSFYLLLFLLFLSFSPFLLSASCPISVPL